jgi:hypothetical protein
MRIKATCVSVAALACLAGTAAADLCSWNFSRGLQPFDDTAGHVDNFNATYDTHARDFTWSVSYSDRMADGFWLVLNSTSPSPSGRSGEVAALYADFANSVLTGLRLQRRRRGHELDGRRQRCRHPAARPHLLVPRRR